MKRNNVVCVMSFGFKYGPPPAADFVGDVRWVKNPFYEPSLRSLPGADELVQQFILDQPSVWDYLGDLRNDIREQVWGGASLEARIDSVTDTVRGFEWFDPSNRKHLGALDERLNQNYFVGLAARRIEVGLSRYLDGESVWEGLLSLVPRLLWPDKPVFGGSPQIVSKMTGLHFSPNTSIGVGNVMEFQINFGIPGVVIGFFVLGWLIGMLDLKAAVAEARGDMGGTILFFLPCVALIQPNGSIVELTGGSAAALVAAYGWRWAWKQWVANRDDSRRTYSYLHEAVPKVRH